MNNDLRKRRKEFAVEGVREERKGDGGIFRIPDRRRCIPSSPCENEARPTPVFRTDPPCRETEKDEEELGAAERLECRNKGGFSMRPFQAISGALTALALLTASAAASAAPLNYSDEERLIVDLLSLIHI